MWRPDPDAIRLVQRFTYLAAVAIDHHRLFGALAESESRFRNAFEGAGAGLALIQLDGRVLKVNPSLSKLVGQPESVLLASNLLSLFDPGSRRRIRAAWESLATGSGAEAADQPVLEVPLAITPGTDPVWVSLTTSIIATEGEQSLYVEVRDVTAARRHSAEQRARQAAEASNRAKSDFLALVSHELRTPLNAILGFAQVLQLSDLSLDAAQRADSIDQMVRAGEHLRDLIDQLLDLSRIEAGQLAVKAERVHTAEVIRTAVDLVSPLAMSRNISLVENRHRADQLHVRADRRCLRQVLINLLGNAVKYTPVNGRVEVVVNELASGNIRIAVNDTGPGIAAESIDQLFQPFHRLESEFDGRAEGTGLGLALTARLMAEMDGTIGVESDVGHGSSFWVEFPPASPIETISFVADRKNTHSPSAPAGALAREKVATGVVLYIEDDEASVQMMRAALQSRPLIELRTAGSATDGAAQLRAGDIDLVLLDIGLPDRSGWDLLCDLRTTSPKLPVVVLTAATDTPSTAVPRYDRLLTKPVDIVEAISAIDSLLVRATSRYHVGQAFNLVQK